MQTFPRILFTLGLAAATCLFVAAGTAIADNGPEHQIVQTRPIQLGTSGGNIADHSKMYCCNGTLGALVEDSSGTQYILSNNHVLGRANLGLPGEGITQPGAIDQNCDTDGIVAKLSTFVPIQFKKAKVIPLNEVDAAIAQVESNAVAVDGAILDIGAISPHVLAPKVNLAVKKSGRTTGFTTGTVAAINVTIDVGYSKSCGGAANQIARFINQIRITPGNFSAAGDSGSLIVEDKTTDPVNGLPRPVGLLFAGSTTTTFASPIGRVLTLLGVAMTDGGTAPSGAVAKGAASASIAKANAAKSRHSAALLANEGVLGHGVGLKKDGQATVEVYVKSDSPQVRGKVPASLDGVPVNVVVTGPVMAY